MARTFSPLRYPGGKSALLYMVSELIVANRSLRGAYAEPFAGGGGLALGLLFEGMVGELHLNDIDPAIAALWTSILEYPEELCARISNASVTIEEWHRQRDHYANSGYGDPLDFGFSTLFLNRTNRSGIIKGAGVIGGLRQTGNYLIDCRFNKEDLQTRVRRIGKYSSRIHFSQMDAIDFLDHLKSVLPKKSLICADPPYFHKGAALYTSFYERSDHEELASAIAALETPWITTYDNCPEVSWLYRTQRQYAFSLQYSAQTKRLGSELMIVSKGLRVPSALPLSRIKPVSSYN